MDQKTNARNDQQKKCGQLIHLKTKRDMERPDTDKIKVVHHYWLKPFMPHFAKDQQTHHKGRKDHPAANDPRHRPGQKIPAQPIDQESGKWQDGDQPN